MENKPISYTKCHKYLGVYIDGPRLTWKSHINNLKNKCAPHVSLMKYISNHKWGADRIMLLRYYSMIIRSKLNYGAIFYSTASKTLLNSLNVIQNTCIRIAIGARKTSPISSLQVESNIMPLSLHRDYLMCQYFFRLRELPKNVNVAIKLNQYEAFEENRYKYPIRPPPLVVRATEILKKFNYPTVNESSLNSLVSPMPPWFEETSYINTFFDDDNVSELGYLKAATVFNYFKYEIYSNYCEIYTDGSKLQVPNSTSAAFIIYEDKYKIIQKFHLPSHTSILGAELYAIHAALNHMKQNFVMKNGIVLYSDSLSGIKLIKNRQPKNYVELVFKIQNLIIELNQFCPTRLQYIPAHKEITGNELVDKLAKEAHEIEKISNISVSKGDHKIYLMNIIRVIWQERWTEEVNITNKGKFIQKIKDKIGYWPWTSHKNRKIESTFCRLRIGHAGVKEHLFRFKLSEDNCCDCGEIESIEHMLIDCQLHTSERNIMKNKLDKEGVNLNLRNLLGGGPYKTNIQKMIIDIAAEFLNNTGKIKVL